MRQVSDQGTPLTREIHIEAGPDVVFEYLTQSHLITRWLGISAEIDPTPGGIFRVDPNGHDEITGKFVEVVPGEKVVFTWGWEGEDRMVPAGSTTVIITLQPLDGGTLLRLEHHLLPAESLDQHEFGWNHYLARLAVASTGQDAGPDPYATPAVRHG